MDNTILRTDEPLTTLQVLTYYLNHFRDKLVANVIDIQHYEFVRSGKPDYKEADGAGGTLDVNTIIEAKRQKIVYARENVRRVEALIEAEKAGTFGELITDEALGRKTIADVLGPDA